MPRPADELKKAQSDLEANARKHSTALEQYTSAASETITKREQLEEQRAALTLQGLPGVNAEARAAYLRSETKTAAEALIELERFERLAKATLTNADTALMVARYRVRVWLALLEVNQD
jgi:hypothetical protein